MAINLTWTPTKHEVIRITPVVGAKVTGLKEGTTDITVEADGVEKGDLF